MKKIGFILILSFFTFLQTACSEFEGGTVKSMQEDFDKIRLDHILVISNLVTEYEEKVGHYPFAKHSKKPIYVTIATEEQIENDKGRSNVFIDLDTRIIDGEIPEQPKSIQSVSLEDFTLELERGLQRKIDIPVDPQRVPMNKPSLYYYTYYLGVFDVTVFLHNSFSFTRNLGEFFNKLTVGHRSYPPSDIWTPKDLMAKKEFIQFFKSPLNRGGYTFKTTVTQ